MRLPRALLPLVVGALLVAGLVVRGPVGVLALALVLVFVGWLSYLSWPRLGQRARLLRLLMLGLLGAFVLADAFSGA